MQPPLSITQHLKAMFHRLDPLDVKKDELLDSQLALLNHQSTLEYSQSMVNYHTGKIKGLTRDI